MRIQTKLLLLLLIISLVPAFLIGQNMFKAHANTLIENEVNELKLYTELHAEELHIFLLKFQREVLYLSKLSNLERFIEGEDTKLELQNDFLAFSKYHPEFYQIRYIDETGKEIVRIDSDGITPRIIPESSLQNKKGRYYFDDTVNFSEGEFFVSPLDLNIENGRLENRGSEDDPSYVPVIRYATPVFNKDGKQKGIVITNIYGSSFLEYAAQDNKISFLINKEGFYLSNPDKTKEFGFMFGNNETLYKDYPEIASQILLGGDIFTSDLIVSSKKINIGIYDSTNYWIMAHITDKSLLLSPVSDLAKTNMFFGGILVIIVIITSLLFANTISKPVKQLVRQAKKIEKGNLEVGCKIEAKDELGDLSRAINKMRLGLKDRNDLLESFLSIFKGKFGNVAAIVIGKEVRELAMKNPRILNIVPKELARYIKRSKVKRK